MKRQLMWFAMLLMLAIAVGWTKESRASTVAIITGGFYTSNHYCPVER